MSGKRRPFRVSIEGNIGSGKSTLLNFFEKFSDVDACCVSGMEYSLFLSVLSRQELPSFKQKISMFPYYYGHSKYILTSCLFNYFTKLGQKKN